MATGPDMAAFVDMAVPPVAAIVATPQDGLSTTDRGGSAQFTVALTSPPTGDVTLPLRSSAPSAGAPTPSSLRFTAQSWATPQTVTVTGSSDHLVTGDIPYQILLGPAVSLDARYAGQTPREVSLTQKDSDRAGLIVTPMGSETSDLGGAAAFSVVLTSQPTAAVTVSFALSDPNLADLSASSLRFAPDQWSTAQQVKITGKYVRAIGGDKSYAVSFGAITSGDALYTALARPADLALLHRDFAPRHCRQIKTALPAAASGTYDVDPDAAGALGALSVYCDMAREGGGWTLVARIADGATAVHRTTEAVGVLTDPTQATTAKLADTVIDLLRETLATSVLKIEANDGTADYFREDKAFVATANTSSMNLVFDTYADATANVNGCRGTYNSTYHTGLVGWECHEYFIYADNPGFRNKAYQAGLVWVK